MFLKDQRKRNINKYVIFVKDEEGNKLLNALFSHD